MSFLNKKEYSSGQSLEAAKVNEIQDAIIINEKNIAQNARDI